MNVNKRVQLSLRSGESLSTHSTHSMSDFNEEDYARHLDELDFNAHQKSEFMRAVWNIMRICVELHAPLAESESVIANVFCQEDDVETSK